jgi:hypothetical protein
LLVAIVDYLWPDNVMTRRTGSFRTDEYVHAHLGGTERQGSGA